ncbi:AAA family ATPase [Arenibacter lacus]|uniref:AAA family ATPase n=1 Tax=Arenibacter lacus TaxID=2608629 RepID=UPI00123E4380|nr:AAA family ATPase [Arenibacter lacus]
MELKYVWIKEYKNLKNIDFNFIHSEDQTFSYENGVLTINTLDKSCPKDFFGSNIIGVTTIVGKNGSGKTNLTELIHYSLSHVGNGGLSRWITSEGILVLGNYIFIQEDVQLNNESEIIDKGYKISRYEHVPLDKNQKDLRWHEMEKNKYIYYNPVFDFRILPMGSGRDNIRNISTSYLAWNDVFHSKLKDWKKADLLRSHERNEKLREADCILNYSEISQFINPIPTELVISIDVVSENGLTATPYYSKDELEGNETKQKQSEHYKDLKTIKEEYIAWYLLSQYKVDNEADPRKYLIPADVKKEYFLGLFWVNFFSIFLKVSDNIFPHNFYRNFIKTEDWELIDKNLAAKLIDLKKNLNEFVELCDWQEKIQAVKDSSESWNERETSYFDLFRHTSYNTSTKQNKKLFNTVVQKTSELLSNNLPFHYQHDNKFSSGQQKQLNFYSRFHWASKEIMKSESDEYGVDGERAIILIDEGEVSLHPEWQRTFFKNAIDFLSKLFKNKDIQLIFITHSPFVLSDIPKENVIFLDRNNKGNAIKSNIDRSQTFGANIYSLLSDSFFMDNGTIGEFAKKKIEWVIEVLNGNASILDPEVLKEVDFIINNVGEPIIKQQLEILRNNVLNKDKITALENQVQELKDELRKRNDNN